MGEYITYWYDNVILAKIVHMDIKLEDGLKVKDCILYIDKDKMEKEKEYAYIRQK